VLGPERQSARLSNKLERVSYTSMALNTLNCNHLTPLGLKGLTYSSIPVVDRVDQTLYWAELRENNIQLRKQRLNVLYVHRFIVLLFYFLKRSICRTQSSLVRS